MEKNQIRELILKAAEAYYNGQEIMTDSEYDALINKLKAIDPTDPLCANGMAAADSNGDEKKINHTMTTGTLAKCANMEELRDWASKKNLKERYSLELKIDGSSMELQYVNGWFTKAITRGDGATGLDRTETLSLMNFPKFIDASFTGSIRAEMVIYNEDFKAHFHDNANPRNAVAGVINRKFSTLTKEQKEDLKYVHAICYDVMGKEFASQSDLMAWLEGEKFEVSPHITVEGVDLLSKANEIRENLRKDIESNKIKFNCDGVVIKADLIDRKDRQRKTPTRDVALKPELETAVSEIIDIVWEMAGSTLSPVAIINPVQLEGTTVSRASLSNMAKMMDLGVEIGKMAVISKHGQIIPMIDKVLA
jgi:DNA ligase (NAD+)